VFWGGLKDFGKGKRGRKRRREGEVKGRKFKNVQSHVFRYTVE
jgi:hypothetical protein